MPQLDKVSYFTQFFWLTLTISVFYLTLLKFYLPKITRVLKMREHKVSLTQESKENTYEQEQERVLQTMQQAVRKSLNQSKQALQSSFETTAGWVEKTVQKTNQEHFQNVQTQYQAKLGDEITANNMTEKSIEKTFTYVGLPCMRFYTLWSHLCTRVLSTKTFRAFDREREGWKERYEEETLSI
jgi:F0F1-type ATP synthase membrane subunit b/b'